jgi:hypothetical protein
MPSAIVYPYKCAVPKDIVENVPEGFLVARSDSGHMNSEIFFEFMANVFIPNLNESRRKQKNLGSSEEMILDESDWIVYWIDGYASHLTLHVSKLCELNHIHLYCFKAHATHICQPNDVGPFEPLKGVWKQTVSKWRQLYPYEIVTRQHFAPLLAKILQKLNPEAVKSGYRATELYPWNPDAVRYDRLTTRIHDASQVVETADVSCACGIGGKRTLKLDPGPFNDGYMIGFRYDDRRNIIITLIVLGQPGLSRVFDSTISEESSQKCPVALPVDSESSDPTHVMPYFQSLEYVKGISHVPLLSNTDILQLDENFSRYTTDETNIPTSVAFVANALVAFPPTSQSSTNLPVKLSTDMPVTSEVTNELPALVVESTPEPRSDSPVMNELPTMTVAVAQASEPSANLPVTSDVRASTVVSTPVHSAASPVTSDVPAMTVAHTRQYDVILKFLSCSTNGSPFHGKRGARRWFQGKISPAFSSQIFYPSPPKQRKVEKLVLAQLFPACVSTQTWRDLHRQKELKEAMENTKLKQNRSVKSNFCNQHFEVR